MTTAVGSTSTVWAPTVASTPTAPATSSNNALGKDAFLKLLVAQMSHQDPDKPMDSSQMSAQLAQFSSVEQLEQINTNLTAQQTSQAAMMSAMNGGIALNALGKQVTAASDAVTVGASGSATPMEVAVADAGGTGTLHVTDARGNELATVALGTLAGGRQAIDTAAATRGLPAGTYHVTVDVKSPTGAAVGAQTFITGRVDKVSYTSTGPAFTIGDITVSMSNVAEIKN